MESPICASETGVRVAAKETALTAKQSAEQAKTKKDSENGNRTYTADDIKVLEGMEAVRLRPAMYVGSNGEKGLNQIVYEVVDNSVVEVLAGYATAIAVTIHIDYSITYDDLPLIPP